MRIWFGVGIHSTKQIFEIVSVQTQAMACLKINKHDFCGKTDISSVNYILYTLKGQTCAACFFACMQLSLIYYNTSVSAGYTYTESFIHAIDTRIDINCVKIIARLSMHVYARNGSQRENNKTETAFFRRKETACNWQ